MSELPTDIATKLLFENDRIRVWEARLEPGEEFPNHMHSYDYVQVFIEGDKIAATIDPSSGGTWEGHAYVEAEVGERCDDLGRERLRSQHGQCRQLTLLRDPGRNQGLSRCPPATRWSRTLSSGPASLTSSV